MDQFLSIGRNVTEFVLRTASFLKNDAIPGLVSLGLLTLLLIAVAHLYIKTGHRRKALKWLSGMVQNCGDEATFNTEFDQLNARVESEKTKNRIARRNIATAWSEYQETIIAQEVDGQLVRRNAVRPSAFFNLEDLGFNAGFWRIIPGLFVTFGLFLTFLGLIAALSSMDFTDPSQATSQISGLVNVASAKFIMSLTGLLCSILFTIALRARMGIVEGEIHRLNGAIEDRLSYISLEALAIEQLATMREQTENSRTVGMELVAELGRHLEEKIARPLNEDLPHTISSSISTAMGPVLERVGQVGADGMGDIVRDLSSQISGDVGTALAQASDRLSGAGDRIATVADRLDQSSGRMGGEMESAISRMAQAVDDLRNSMASTAESTSGALNLGAERLLAVMNETLEGIRDNTGDGAKAMSAAAAEMREAAEGFKSELQNATDASSKIAQERMEAASETAGAAIDQAGVTVLSSLQDMAEALSKNVDETSRQAKEEILVPMVALAEALDALSGSVSTSTTEMRKMADGVRAGAESVHSAAGAFSGATTALTDAAAPMRASTERIEASVVSLERSTAQTAGTIQQSSQAIAKAALDTLETAKESLGGERRAIEAALSGLANALEQLRGQGERLDTMDQKLGRAFELYNTQVEAAVNGISGHVRDMQAQLNPAIDTLKTVVEQAENFSPQQPSYRS